MTEFRSIPRCALVVALYAIGCILFGGLLILLHLPDAFFMIAAGPILWAAFRYPRRVYLAMSVVAASCALWVSHTLSPNFASSQQTISVAMLTWIGISELTHRLVAARDRAEEAYRALVESSPQGMAILQDSRMVFVNPALCAMLGHTKKELLAFSSKEIYALVHPQDQLVAAANLEVRLREQSGSAKSQFRIIGRAGRVIYTDIETTAITYRGQTALQIALTDITTQRGAEQALRQSEERLRLLVESTGDIVMMQDLDGRYLYFNSSPQYGVNDQEMIGKTPYDIHDHASAERLVSRVKQVASSGQPLIEETPLPWRGETLYFSDLLSPVRDGNGQVIAIVTASRNITERRHAEDALRASEAMLQSILRAAPIAIGVLVKRMVTWVNEQMCVMSGYASAELLGQSARLLYESDEEFQRVGQVKYAEIAQKGTGSIETRWKRKDGQVIDVWLSSATVEPDNLQGQVIFTAMDITERTQMQKRLVQQERFAAVGQLAAGIAHDFNNILAGILGFAELVRMNEKLSEQSQADIQAISQEAQRGAHLVRQILDFSRRSIRAPQSLDLLPFLKENIKFLQRTIPENCTIELQAASAEYWLEADPAQLQQALTNLALNARDAMPEGGQLTIALGRLRVFPGGRAPVAEMRPGEWLCLAVADTGQGIPAELLPRIFEPFFTTKHPSHNAGLGLAQVQGIIQQHGGHITVDSEPGRGTSFALYFPALPTKAQIPPPKEEAQTPMGAGQLILLVEDEPHVRSSTRLLLESLGYRTVCAATGDEALALYPGRSAEFSLVFSDLIMPGIGGLELCERLLEINPNLRMAIMSGYPLEQDTESLCRSHIYALLMKPFSRTELARAVQQALTNNTQVFLPADPRL